MGQVSKVFGVPSGAVVGGVDYIRQRDWLLTECPTLIAATPGRMRALCGEVPASTRLRAVAAGANAPPPIVPDVVVRLHSVSRLVLDEADRLLDEGFEEDSYA